MEGDVYRSQLPDAQGVVQSRVFRCLRLPVAPLPAGDAAKVLAVLPGQELVETSIKGEDLTLLWPLTVGAGATPGSLCTERSVFVFAGGQR